MNIDMQAVYTSIAADYGCKPDGLQISLISASGKKLKNAHCDMYMLLADYVGLKSIYRLIVDHLNGNISLRWRPVRY